MKCVKLTYLIGYQVVLAVHHARNDQKGNKGVHIHLVLNAINVMTGKIIAY